MSRQAIESAIADIPSHENPDFASGIAEGLVIAYFTSQVIDSDEFKDYCAQIRAESQARAKESSMNIDWSKAPEGTTGAMVAGFSTASVGFGGIEWIPSSGTPLEHYSQGSDAWTYHVAPKPWNGEGLPPVGTVCEFAGFNPQETLPADPVVGDRVTVIAHYLSGCVEVAAFTFNCSADFGSLYVAQGAHGCFRPIRTAEQIEADEREKGICEIYAVLDNNTRDLREDAEVLWGLGYRKQEPTR